MIIVYISAITARYRPIFIYIAVPEMEHTVRKMVIRVFRGPRLLAWIRPTGPIAMGSFKRDVKVPLLIWLACKALRSYGLSKLARPARIALAPVIFSYLDSRYVVFLQMGLRYWKNKLIIFVSMLSTIIKVLHMPRVTTWLRQDGTQIILCMSEDPRSSYPPRRTVSPQNIPTRRDRLDCDRQWCGHRAVQTISHQNDVQLARFFMGI